MKTNSYAYLTDGTAALKPRTCTNLYVIEGAPAATYVQMRRDERHARREAAKQSSSRAQTVIAACIACLMLCGMLFGANAMASRREELRREWLFGSVVTTSTVVRAGDSLWDIALEHGVSNASTPEVVDWIIRENALSNATIMPGQKLVVPSGTEC